MQPRSAITFVTMSDVVEFPRATLTAVQTEYETGGGVGIGGGVGGTVAGCVEVEFTDGVGGTIGLVDTVADFVEFEGCVICA